MEVYSAQTAWEVIRDNTEVFVLVGCDPIKNNRVEYTVADHGMSGPWEQIRDNGCKFISINPQNTASDAYLNADWVRIIPNTDVALFLRHGLPCAGARSGRPRLHGRNTPPARTSGSPMSRARVTTRRQDARMGLGHHRHRRRQDPRTGRTDGQVEDRDRRRMVAATRPSRRDDPLGHHQLRGADRQDRQAGARAWASAGTMAAAACRNRARPRLRA